MDLINGPEFHHCFRESQQNSVSKDGMSGLTPVLKKHNGHEQKIKNYCN